MKQSVSFSESIVQWLAQLDERAEFIKLLTLCANDAIYIVDKSQRLVYWSPGAEKLSGISQVEISINPYRPEIAIIEGGLSQQTVLMSFEGQQVRLNKKGLVLKDQFGQFAGGLGLLSPCFDTSENESLIKTLNQSKQNFHGIIRIYKDCICNVKLM